MYMYRLQINWEIKTKQKKCIVGKSAAGTF
jgi:hypothetical protein